MDTTARGSCDNNSSNNTGPARIRTALLEVLCSVAFRVCSEKRSVCSVKHKLTTDYKRGRRMGRRRRTCAEHAFSGTSWTALTLETGKSPTATPWRAELPVAYRSRPRFASSLRRRAVAGPRTVRFSTTGANMVSRTKERALDLLLVPALPALATPSLC